MINIHLLQVERARRAAVVGQNPGAVPFLAAVESRLDQGAFKEVGQGFGGIHVAGPVGEPRLDRRDIILAARLNNGGGQPLYIIRHDYQFTDPVVFELWRPPTIENPILSPSGSFEKIPKN